MKHYSVSVILHNHIIFLGYYLASSDVEACVLARYDHPTYFTFIIT